MKLALVITAALASPALAEPSTSAKALADEAMRRFAVERGAHAHTKNDVKPLLTRLTRQKARRLFLRVLDVLGFTVVPKGTTWHVVPLHLSPPLVLKAVETQKRNSP